MGKKGDKLTSQSTLEAEILLERLGVIEGITSKRMFGGNGIFHNGKMFGMVDSKGHSFLKVDESIKSDFEEKGGIQFGKMPYFSIPEEVFDNDEQLEEWAKKSIAISK